MLLAVAITFLELLFPVFTEMVVDKVIVEKDPSGCSKPSCSGWARRLFFVQASSLAQEYLLSFRRRPAGHRHPRFPQPANVVAADELFHQPAHRRHSAPARWRAAGAAIRGPPRHRRPARARQLGRRDFPDGDLQPVAHVRLPRHHAALRRADVFSRRKCCARCSPTSRRARANTARTRSTRSKASKRLKPPPRNTVFRDMMLNEFLARLAQDFPEQFHRHDLRQRAANHRHALDRDLSLGRREPGHGGQSQHRRVRRLQLAHRDGLRRHPANVRRVGSTCSSRPSS